MIFTHFGISGPTILSGSAHLAKYKDIDDLLKTFLTKNAKRIRPILAILYLRANSIPLTEAHYDFLTKDTYPSRRWRFNETSPRW